MNIRRAKIEDSKEISELMGQLGYKTSCELIISKLSEFIQTSIDVVFVAEINDAIVGIISCHITSLFHQKGNSGRITSLVINNNYRGLGIGKSLV